MNEHELALLPALEQARLVRDRIVKPTELVALYLDRIASIDPALNAYVTVAGEQAQQAAAAAEATMAEDSPAFHGVPISVKDLVATAGIRTTYGLPARKAFVPEADEHSVTRLRAGGFVILGKTNVPEMGSGPVTEPPAYGPTRNPWDLARSAGGSSGGAAAALAAGLCPISHGTDGGGSIRVPSAWCGLVGLKPSRGRILAHPSAINMHATVGPIARTVADAAAMLDVLCGPALGPNLWGLPTEPSFLGRLADNPGRLRIAVSDGGCVVPPGYRDALDGCAALLADLGHQVEEAEPMPGWPAWYYDRVFTDDTLRMRAVDLELKMASEPMFDPQHPSHTGVLGRGDGMSAIDFAVTSRQLAADVARWAGKALAFFDTYDLLLTPTVAAQPLPIGAGLDLPYSELWRLWYESVPFTTLWNHSGQPAVSLPAAVDPDGLPIGLQLVGRPAGEATLLQVARQLEQRIAWSERVPPIAVLGAAAAAAPSQ